LAWFSKYLVWSLSAFGTTLFVTLNTSHVAIIFDILCLYISSCHGVYRFFYYFGNLLPILHGSFLCYGFLLSILYYSLLLHWFTHTTIHATKTARLETGEIAHAITSSKTSSTEKIIIKTSKGTEATHIHLLLSRIIILPPFATTHLLAHLTTHLMTHSHALSKTCHVSHWTSTKEIVLIIEKALKWILSTKKVPKYFISWFHIEMIKISTKIISILELEISVTASLVSSIDHVISAELIIILSLFLIRQNSVCKGYFFKNFFSLFFIIWVFIWMVLKWQFSVSLFYVFFRRISRHT